MLTHADIWRAIDALASENGLTASGLARKAGLDPTTFNKSKRVTASGRLRWPSTESLAKALEAAHTTLGEFVNYVEEGVKARGSHPIPVAALSNAAAASAYGATGNPSGAVWSYMQFPDMLDPDAYAITVEGDDYRPVLRNGALVVAAPHAGIRTGDRVVVRLTSARIILGELAQRNAERIELRHLTGGEACCRLAAEEVAALHRIVWAGQ